MTKQQFPIRLNKEVKSKLKEVSRKSGYSMQKISEIALESLLLGAHPEQVVLIQKLANQND